MSISRNVGGLSSRSDISKSSSFVSRITATRSYQRIRDLIDKGLLSIPFFGYRLFQFVMRMKRGVKAVFLKETIFSELGFEYVGPIDGHSISMVTKVLENVKKLHKPVIVHVVTRKGKGYKKAEDNPSDYHGVSPLPAPGDKDLISKNTFTRVFGTAVAELARKDPGIVAVTAAMGKGTGLKPFKEEFPDRFFDVGIAEQHAVTFGAGLAAAGVKPVVAVYSTFMQRAVDQLIHDIAIPGLPVVIAMDRSGLVSSDGETHQGVFDISLFRSIPGITILSPGSAEEFRLMISYSFSSDGPVLLRYPKAECPEGVPGTDYPLVTGKGVFIRETGSKTLLMTIGGLVAESLKAADILQFEGLDIDLYNLRFLKPIDNDNLYELLTGYANVILVEEGSRSGGIGEYIAALISERGLDINFGYHGVPERFLSQALRSELLAVCGLDGSGIASFVRQQAGVEIPLAVSSS